MDNDEAFREEKENLAVLEKDIDDEISSYQKKNKSLKKECSFDNVVDYDSQYNYVHARDRLNRNMETISQLTRIKEEPYFGRMDLEDENETNKLYIGKEGLWLDYNQRVVDWRTDVGDAFYRRDFSGKFTIDGVSYRLMLKRKINIKNQVLKDCETVYDRKELAKIIEERARQSNTDISAVIRNPSELYRRSYDSLDKLKEDIISLTSQGFFAIRKTYLFFTVAKLRLPADEREGFFQWLVKLGVQMVEENDQDTIEEDAVEYMPIEQKEESGAIRNDITESQNTVTVEEQDVIETNGVRTHVADKGNQPSEINAGKATEQNTSGINDSFRNTRELKSLILKNRNSASLNSRFIENAVKKLGLDTMKQIEFYDWLIEKKINIYGQIEDYEQNDEIVDPFLIEVLKDKRRNNAVTDIIRTIQGNQNEIIRTDVKKNFAVQGCAGSGKTMILLHRLSYILYNKLLASGDIKIITPNRYFDSQIDNLGRELDISLIERKTVEEYYSWLYEKSTGTTLKDSYSDDSSVGHDILENIYSGELSLSASDFIEKCKNNILNEARKKKIDLFFSMASEKGFGARDTIPETINYLTSAIDRILKKHEVTLSCQNILSGSEEILKAAEPVVNTLIARAKEVISLISGEIQNNAGRIAELQDKVSNINSENNEYQNEISRKTKILKNITDIKSAIALENDTPGFSVTACQTVRDYKELKKEYENTSIISFIRRNTLSNRMRLLEDKFRSEKNTYLDYDFEQLKISADEKNRNSADETTKLSGEISELKNRNSKITEEKNLLQSKLINVNLHEMEISELLNHFALLQSVEHMNLIKQLCMKRVTEQIEDKENETKTSWADDNPGYLSDNGVSMLKSLNDLINSSVIALTEIKRNNNAFLVEYNGMRQKYGNDIQMELLKLGEEDVSGLKEFKDNLTKYSYKNVENHIFKQLVKIKPNVNCRCTLYARNLIAWLYYKKTVDKVKLLCFDEAQDLAEAEYELFRNMNDPKCVYNLYGDINQTISDYELLTGWEDCAIPDIEVYELNENYRNSSQITKYCNKIFANKMYPIGVSGQSDVLAGDFKTCLELVNNHKEINHESRCVVIYTENNENMTIVMNELAKRDGYAWNELDNTKVCFMPIRLCKGLEFDCVLVLDHKMSNNEEYIAYTRALDNLIISDDMPSKIKSSMRLNKKLA